MKLSVIFFWNKTYNNNWHPVIWRGIYNKWLKLLANVTCMLAWHQANDYNVIESIVVLVFLNTMWCASLYSNLRKLILSYHMYN